MDDFTQSIAVQEIVDSKIQMLATPEMTIVPRVGDKLVVDGDEDSSDESGRFAKIYEVIDVHINISHPGVDVLVKSLGSNAKYRMELAKRKTKG